MRVLTCPEVDSAARDVASFITHTAAERGAPRIRLEGIPRGGLPAAYAIARMLAADGDTISYVTTPAGQPNPFPSNEFVVLVDDIYVTGETMARYTDPSDPTMGVALVVKEPLGRRRASRYHYFGISVPENEWVQFPWEVADEDEGKPEDAVRRLIEYLGDDPARAGVQDTPKRVLKFLDELREQGNGDFHATAFDIAHDDLVIVRSIPFYALCEHHMLPFFGTASVGYIPVGNKVLGLSKLARIAGKASARLGTQEGITALISDGISKASDSPNVAVVTQAVHTCMVMRGVKAYGAETITSSMLGSFRERPELRQEFLSLTVAGAR